MHKAIISENINFPPQISPRRGAEKPPTSAVSVIFLNASLRQPLFFRPRWIKPSIYHPVELPRRVISLLFPIDFFFLCSVLEGNGLKRVLGALILFSELVEESA